MYTVSSLYKTKIAENDRTSKIIGTLTLKNGKSYNLDEGDFKLSSIVINNQCVDNDEINLGSVYSSQLQCEMLTSIDRFKLYNAVIELKFGLLTDYIRNKWEYVPLGKFTITEATKSYNVTKITALDRMIRFEKKLPKKFKFYGSVYGLLVNMCKACKMELGQPKTDIEKLTNGNVQNVYINYNHKSMTYRDLVSHTAQFLCGFATIDRHGKLVIKQFSEFSIDTISDKLRSSVDVSDRELQYQQLTCTSKGEEWIYNETLAENDEVLTIDLGENDLLQFGTLAERRARFKAIGDKITMLKYVPCDLDYVGNPALDLGDRLELLGGQLNDNRVYTVITNSSWSFRNKQKITGAGKSLVGTTLTKADKTANEYGMGSNTTSNFLVCENKETYTITNSEKVLHEIRFSADEPCIVLMRTIVCVNSSVECNITFGYDINGTTITDFIPTQKIQIGNNIINLLYPIEKENIKDEGKTNVVKLSIKSDSATSISILPRYSKTILNGNAIIEDESPEWEEPDYGQIDPFEPSDDQYFNPDLPDYDFDYPVCPFDPEYESCPENWDDPECPFRPGELPGGGFPNPEDCPYYKGGGGGDNPGDDKKYDPNAYDNGTTINIDFTDWQSDGYTFLNGGTIWVATTQIVGDFAVDHATMDIGRNSVIPVNEWDKIEFPVDIEGFNGVGDILWQPSTGSSMGFTMIVEFTIHRAHNGKTERAWAPLQCLFDGNPYEADFDKMTDEWQDYMDYALYINPRFNTAKVRGRFSPLKGSEANTTWIVPKYGVDYDDTVLKRFPQLRGGLLEGDTYECHGIKYFVIQNVNKTWRENNMDFYPELEKYTERFSVTKYTYKK